MDKKYIFINEEQKNVLEMLLKAFDIAIEDFLNITEIDNIKKSISLFDEVLKAQNEIIQHQSETIQDLITRVEDLEYYAKGGSPLDD